MIAYITTHRMRRIVILIIAGIVMGCSTITSNMKVDASIPRWVTGSSQREGMLCAVGISEPTFYRDDAKRNAEDNARKELAMTLSVDIKTIMVEIATERGSYVDEGTITEVSSWATSAVLSGAEIIEYWYDKDGAAPSKKAGITYALACMPLDSVPTDISERPTEGGEMPDLSDALERLKKINKR